MWFPLIPLYVFAAVAQHPLFIVSPFAQRVQLRYIQLLARYFGYQRSMSSFLFLSRPFFLFGGRISAQPADYTTVGLRCSRSARGPRSHKGSNSDTYRYWRGTLDTKEACPLSPYFSTPLFLFGELMCGCRSYHGKHQLLKLNTRRTSLPRSHNGSN